MRKSKKLIAINSILSGADDLLSDLIPPGETKNKVKSIILAGHRVTDAMHEVEKWFREKGLTNDESNG